MQFNPVVIATRAEKPAWYLLTASYAQPCLRMALWQLAATLIPYFLLLALMVQTVRRGYPYFVTLALALVASVLLLRIFIFFHDCTHGAFLPSPRWNRNVGYLCGLLTFTAFHDWRRSHAGHHISAGDLDRRGVGDIWTLTVAEYRAAPFWRRLGYRLYRHPLVTLGFGPTYYFLLRNRYPSNVAKKKEVLSVIGIDLALLAIAVVASLTIGLQTYLLVQLPVLVLAATAGIWLFYVQHQFQGVYWARHKLWDPWRVPLEGCSYYRLPKFLQWCSGNIGFHHVHHARPGIPNYRLQQCHEGVAELRAVKPLGLGESLKSLRLNLWDEEQGRLVSFREVSRCAR